MAEKLIPLGGKIIVKRLEAENKTKGGIVLPETAKEKPQEGKIIALGVGKIPADGTRADFQFKKNDRVIFASYAGTEVKVKGEEYLVMSEDDILAVIE